MIICQFQEIFRYIFSLCRSELGCRFSTILFNMRNNPSLSQYWLISWLSCSLPHLTLLFHSVNNIVYQHAKINDDFVIFFYYNLVFMTLRYRALRSLTNTH